MAVGTEGTSFSSRKEWEVFAHTLGQVFLVAVIVFGINYLATRHGKRHDLTTEGIQSLSGKTRATLDSLPGGIEIYSFLDDSQRSGRFVPEAIAEVESNLADLLWQYADYSDRVTYEVLDLHQQRSRVEVLHQEFGIQDANRILVVARSPDGQVSQRKILTLEDVALPPEPLSYRRIGGFRGDEALVQAIRTVTTDEVISICFTTGHGETDPSERMALLKAYLEEEAYRFETVDLRSRGRVPEGCGVLVVAGGERPFEGEEVEAVIDYLHGGGNLLLAADPGWETGLDEALEEVGLELHDDEVVVALELDIRARGIGAIGQRFIPSLHLDTDDLGPTHPVTRKLVERRYRVAFEYLRSIGPFGDIHRSRYQYLVRTNAQSFGETDGLQTSGVRPGYDEERDHPGPLDVAAAVEVPFGDPGLESTPVARAIVVGDASFLEDEPIAQVANREFAYGALLWLAGRDPIELPPPDPNEWKADLEEGEFLKLFLGFLLIPVGCFAAGIVVWFLRKS